jgi:hypothetical protein
MNASWDSSPIWTSDLREPASMNGRIFSTCSSTSAPALEELRDDVDRLAEHLVTLADRGPALPHDVLVEVLPGAEAEPKASKPARSAFWRSPTSRSGRDCSHIIV